MSLINCEINIILTWPVNSVLSSIAKNQGTAFLITDTKLYVPVVALSTQDNITLLQQSKSGFKRASYWNKFCSKAEPLQTHI